MTVAPTPFEQNFFCIIQTWAMIKERGIGIFGFAVLAIF